MIPKTVNNRVAAWTVAFLILGCIQTAVAASVKNAGSSSDGKNRGSVSEPAGKNFAKGYFEIDGKQVQVSHAYAETAEDLFDSTKKVFRVFLTDRPLSSEDWRRELVSRSNAGELQYIELTIKPAWFVAGIILKTPLLKKGYVSAAGGDQFEAKAVGPAAVEGTAFSGARELGGQKFSYRVEFRAVPEEDAGKKPEPGYDRSLFASPENKAIEKMLLDAGDDEILKAATGITSSNLGDFATAEIHCKQNGKEAQVPAYLFKTEGRWTAYRKIPTHLDHPGMFFLLARQHCADTWKHFDGIGYLDDSWKTKDPKKRSIKFNCSELVNNEWKDHPLQINYAFDKQKGWGLTGVDDLEAPTPSAKKPETQKPVAPRKTKEFPEEAVNRFFLSIMEGDAQKVKGFLDAGMSPNVKRPRLGHSPLFAAALGGRDAMALMFIEAGGDVNFTDENGSTPLMEAAGQCQSAPLVKVLIDAGADVNARAKGGGTPLLNAEIFKCAKIAKILKAAGAK